MSNILNQRITIPPAGAVVTLATMKNHLKLDPSDTSEDELLAIYIESATEYLQNELRLQFMKATYEATIDNWGDNQWRFSSGVPLISIESVVYTDIDGNAQTMVEGVDYLVNYRGHKPFIYFQNTPDLGVWFNAIEITYTAGYNGGTVEEQRAAVPKDIVNGIILRAAAMYENREDKQLDPSKILASMHLTGIYKNSYF